MIEKIFEVLSPSQIEWVSLGSFRYRKSLKKIINERHKNTRLFTGEHIASKDGKHRYLRSLRNEAYKNLRQPLKKYLYRFKCLSYAWKQRRYGKELQGKCRGAIKN